MKDSKVYADRLAALLKQLEATFDVPTPAPLDPVAQLISAFLMWEANSVRADQAFQRIQSHIVDYNDLRVCCTHDVIKWIGERYPRGRARIDRLRAALRAIYEREHDITLDRVIGLTNREARQWIETLEGVTPYVSAQWLLFSKRAHAMPIDEQLRSKLIAAEIIDRGTDLLTVQAWLERHVRAADAAKAHLLLQGWVEEGGAGGRPHSTGGAAARLVHKGRAVRRRGGPS